MYECQTVPLPETKIRLGRLNVNNFGPNEGDVESREKRRRPGRQRRRRRGTCGDLTSRVNTLHAARYDNGRQHELPTFPTFGHNSVWTDKLHRIGIR